MLYPIETGKTKDEWDWTLSQSSTFFLVHWKERLSKNQFDLTVRKDERFLLSLSLLLSIHETVNTLEESIRLNCQERRKIPSISPWFLGIKSSKGNSFIIKSRRNESQMNEPGPTPLWPTYPLQWKNQASRKQGLNYSKTRWLMNGLSLPDWRVTTPYSFVIFSCPGTSLYDLNFSSCSFTVSR